MNKRGAGPKFKMLDVRPTLERGEHPFREIMEAVAQLAPGEGIALLTPFLPSPLIERLQADGFQSRPERQSDGSWRTFFWRD